MDRRRRAVERSVEVRRSLLGGRELDSLELGDIDRRGRSTSEGLPAKTTETTRAVSSWLPLRLADVSESSLPDSKSKSEKSSVQEEASSSEERYTSWGAVWVKGGCSAANLWIFKSSIREARRELFCGKAGTPSMGVTGAVEGSEEIISTSGVSRVSRVSRLCEGSGRLESRRDSICGFCSVTVISGMEAGGSLVRSWGSTRDIGNN